MSSERGRVILIFGAVMAIAAGAGFYFYKVYRPAEIRENAQDEIVRWEARFAAARWCLLGPEPASSKTSEALAIREMAPDPWDRGSCTKLISKLSRGEAPESGLPAVEAAWADLDHAASKAALAFADHVGSSTTLRADPLPDALDALDAARAKLRTSAGLPASTSSGSPLPAAAILPLAEGADPLVEVRVDSLPSAHGIVVFGRATTAIQIVLAPGAKPQLAHVTDSALRAVPDLSWGATMEPAAITMGAMDAESAIAAGTTAKLENGSVAAAAGTLAEGELVYGTGTQLFIAHAKAGTITSDPPVKIRAGQATTDLDGRTALIWQVAGARPDDPVMLWGRILAPGADQDPVELGPDLALGAMCMTKDRAYVRTGDSLVGFGGGKPVAMLDVGGSKGLVGCTPDAVLLRERAARLPLTICTDTCRDVALPTGAPQSSATTVVGGKLVAIASHGGVLGVWREGSAPAFYGLPEIADPVLAHEWPAMALTDGKTIDILARGTKTFVVIRI